jgi:maltose O-acetyltransferase
MSQHATNDGRSEREKMLAGDLYTSDDPELVAAQRHAYRLMREYERCYASSAARAQKILRELLGAVGPDVHVKPPLYVDYGKHVTIGAGTFANYGLVALDVATITIGSNVKIGPNVQLLTPTHPVDPQLRLQRLEAAKPIVIEDNVWLGGGAIVLAGVTVGRNSVIGAGAVVTKNVPADVVAAGNPLRLIRSLSPPD